MPALKDEDIDYSDIPELGDDFFEKVTFVPAKQMVTIRLDADVVAWLKRSGKGYQTRTPTIFFAPLWSHRNGQKRKESNAS